mgnify:FL=1|tara:strand:- start:234 stop:1025 length:792 start_codon:yes stop_codon:yes gene_type:complete
MQVKPKKSLGQNFLKDENILKLIVDKANINKNDNVIEIGPGTGNLTKEILFKMPCSVTVIEKDKNLSNILKLNFKNKIKLINKDFLLMEEKDIKLTDNIILGNLPYNVSTEILIKLIKLYTNFKYKKLLLMFQKEVADRITADFDTRNYGRLSIISQFAMDIYRVKDVSPNCFYPKPKVSSTLLLFIPKKKVYNINELKNLEFITRTFFSLRRKMIKKPLKQIFKNFSDIVLKLKLNPNDRPQNLNPLTYYKICKEYEKSIYK